MEPSSSDIKIFSYFLIFREIELLGPSSKNKNNYPEKKFLLFQKMELSDSKIKKYLIFSQKKKNGFLIFLKMEPCTFSPTSKNKKIHPKKISYTLISKKIL